MKVFVGSDHNGFRLREELVRHLTSAGYDVVDDGGQQLNPDDDYPVFAQKVVNDILKSDDHEPRGILLCGSGQGMCMAANRFKGIRAALLYDRTSAREARNDDDSNIACLPASSLKKEEAFAIVETWLETPFAKAARYIRRINEMDALN